MNNLLKSLAVPAIIILGVYAYSVVTKASPPETIVDLEQQVVPQEGVVTPIRWGNLGARLVDAGVIDADKLELIYTRRTGGLNKEERLLLSGESEDSLLITRENSGFLLNLFWALGLSNKNEILDFGPMMDSRYGGAGGFASTGGWTLAKGGAMSHYSRHSFVLLTKEQQELVKRVSQNIYRPCCDNPTHFPDCNHGMAMLGFLGIMAAQGVSEEDMYRYALAVNSYWFPDTYLAIAQYFQTRGIDWNDVNPKEVLGKQYSSASGYGWVLSKLNPLNQSAGSSCSL